MLALRTAIAALLATCLVACAAAPEAKLAENQNAELAGQGVSVRAIGTRQLFRGGKRVTVRRATVLVKERAAIQKHDVLVGDDVIIGGRRWQVVEIIEGGAASLGYVLLREVR